MVNKAIIVGRLGADPELKYLESGEAVCNFTMATSESWTSKDGEKKERTEWHKVIAWGRKGEVCAKYLSKGKEVYVEGKLQTRKYIDKDDIEKYTTQIVATNVTFLGGGSKDATGKPSDELPLKNNSHESWSASTGLQQQSFTADEIPF